MGLEHVDRIDRYRVEGHHVALVISNLEEYAQGDEERLDEKIRYYLRYIQSEGFQERWFSKSVSIELHSLRELPATMQQIVIKYDVVSVA